MDIITVYDTCTLVTRWCRGRLKHAVPQFENFRIWIKKTQRIKFDFDSTDQSFQMINNNDNDYNE